MRQILVVLWAAGSLVGCTRSESQQTADTPSTSHPAADATVALHEPWRTIQAFTADEVRQAAARVRFQSTSTTPPEARDVLDYYDVTSSRVSLNQDGPIVVGRARFVTQNARIKETNEAIPAGEFYHWIGRKSGVWMGGYSSVDGNVSLRTEVRFSRPPDEPHTHRFIHVFTHDPAATAALLAQIPGRPPLPPRVPPREPPRDPPPPPDDPPPPPPTRCVEVCKYIVDVERNIDFWIPTGWISVTPA